MKSAASHERFRADLSRMIGLILAGRKDDARAEASPSRAAEIPALPALALTDIDGRKLSREDLAGRVVLVEFWATWCPPCRGTLAWLGELKKRYGDRLVVVALALESEEANVRKLAAEMSLPLTWAMGSTEVARAFGDVSAVPTLFLFDREGRTASVLYGAPPPSTRTRRRGWLRFCPDTPAPLRPSVVRVLHQIPAQASESLD